MTEATVICIDLWSSSYLKMACAEDDTRQVIPALFFFFYFANLEEEGKQFSNYYMYRE